MGTFHSNQGKGVYLTVRLMVPERALLHAHCTHVVMETFHSKHGKGVYLTVRLMVPEGGLLHAHCTHVVMETFHSNHGKGVYLTVRLMVAEGTKHIQSVLSLKGKRIVSMRCVLKRFSDLK